MTKLPDPYAYIGKAPVYSANQVKNSFEAGRKAMLDEVLRVAPESLAVLLQVLDDRKTEDATASKEVLK